MKEQITDYFNKLFGWVIDTGLFYLTGRDVGFLLIGFLICLVLWGAFATRSKNEQF